MHITRISLLKFPILTYMHGEYMLALVDIYNSIILENNLEVNDICN